MPGKSALYLRKRVLVLMGAALVLGGCKKISSPDWIAIVHYIPPGVGTLVPVTEATIERHANAHVLVSRETSGRIHELMSVGSRQSCEFAVHHVRIKIRNFETGAETFIDNEGCVKSRDTIKLEADTLQRFKKIVEETSIESGTLPDDLQGRLKR